MLDGPYDGNTGWRFFATGIKTESEMEGRVTWKRLRPDEDPGELTCDTLHVKAYGTIDGDGTGNVTILFENKEWTDIHKISILHTRTPDEYIDYVDHYSKRMMPRALRYMPVVRDQCLLRLVWMRLNLHDVFPSEVFVLIASYLVYEERECIVCDRWLAQADMLDWDFARCKKCVKRRK